MTVNRQVIEAVEAVAPRRLQEGYDNTGLQCGTPDAPCTGVLLCVDLTESIVDEAVARGCNLIVTHHPLLFNAIKRIDGEGRVQRALLSAIKRDITVYSCHTAVDNAPAGISHEMARKLGLVDVVTLEGRHDDQLGSVGSGVIGMLPGDGLSPEQFVQLAKCVFHSPVARCSKPEALPGDYRIKRVGLCGGAGSFLIEPAIALGAQAFLTSDCKFNCFIDYAASTFLVDLGHYETEECAKDIFYHAITKKIPNFAVYYSNVEKNPIKYM
ncbi:MAG: Nif3-like dinuclear metal center hexameric protein [Clostridiales bacterium]|nr:Nif3-like dinuclear metal center hexameric protein [Clostridiales bacterium]